MNLDLLGISDQETWRYGLALRAMAERKAFSHLAFSRLQDLVAVKNLPDDLVELSYVANATNFRRTLLNMHGRDGDIDIDHEIATNPDTLMTYKGYCRFMESDLQYIFGCAPKGRIRAYKRDVKYLVKQMLIRGYVSSSSLCLTYSVPTRPRRLTESLVVRPLREPSRHASRTTYVSVSTSQPESTRYPSACSTPRAASRRRGTAASR